MPSVYVAVGKIVVQTQEILLVDPSAKSSSHNSDLLVDADLV